MGWIDCPGDESGSISLGVAIAAFEAVESLRLVDSDVTPGSAPSELAAV